MPYEDYEDRKQSRADRYRDYAKQARRRAEQADEGARQAVEGIPLGQPILVGHHSEGRHRRALARCDARMRQMVKEGAKAKYWEGRANAIEASRAVSKHDPEAIEKLRERIEKAERYQEVMRAANRIVRGKRLSRAEKIERLKELMPHVNGAELLTPDFAGRLGFPAYALQNNNANIRRMKQRIADLERERARDEVEDEVGGVQVVESGERDSTELHFPGRPSAELLGKLRLYGWRWARRAKCWYKKRRCDGVLAEARRLAAEYGGGASNGAATQSTRCIG